MAVSSIRKSLHRFWVDLDVTRSAEAIYLEMLGVHIPEVQYKYVMLVCF